MVKKIKRSRKKSIFIALTLTISVFLFIYLGPVKNIKHFNGNSKPIATENEKNVNYSPPSEQDKAESNRNKNEIIQNMDKPAQTTQSSGAPIAITLTRASRTNVGVYIEKLGEGYCDLKITQGGVEKISLKAKVIASAEYSTCEGFSLDSSKLDNTTFKINISVYSGNRQGSVSQEVN